MLRPLRETVGYALPERRQPVASAWCADLPPLWRGRTPRRALRRDRGGQVCLRLPRYRSGEDRPRRRRWVPPMGGRSHAARQTCSLSGLREVGHAGRVAWQGWRRRTRGAHSLPISARGLRQRRPDLGSSSILHLRKPCRAPRAQERGAAMRTRATQASRWVRRARGWGCASRSCRKGRIRVSVQGDCASWRKTVPRQGPRLGHRRTPDGAATASVRARWLRLSARWWGQRA